ncbi:MAG: response regulator [Ignavibacteriales bacterium]|nr:response regulator [Ignavibacteriales bacterium]
MYLLQLADLLHKFGNSGQALNLKIAAVCSSLRTILELDDLSIYKLTLSGELLCLGSSNIDRKVGQLYACQGCSLINERNNIGINSAEFCELKDNAAAEFNFCMNYPSGANFFLMNACSRNLPDESAMSLLIDFLQLIDKYYQNDSDFLNLFVNESTVPNPGTNSANTVFSDEDRNFFREYLIRAKSSGISEFEKSSTPEKEIFDNILNDLNILLRQNLNSQILPQSDNISIHDVYFEKNLLGNILLFITLFLTANKIRQNITIKVEDNVNNNYRFLLNFKNEFFGDIDFRLLKSLFESQSSTELKNFHYTDFLSHSIELVSVSGNKLIFYFDESSFTFEFELKGERMTDFTQTLSQLPKTDGKSNILVIEDDYATSRMMTNYLQKWGYTPKVVNSAEETFQSLKSEHYLAVILDIELPTYNGLELLKELRESPDTKHIPVIVFSVHPEQQKAFLMGAVEYFVKPINYNFLVEVLTNYKLRSNSKILCVDDDVPTLNLIKSAIETSGFIPIAENVSANVMDRISDIDLDLAIVDLDMPYPNGFELIKLIKSSEKFARLPIIIYTGKENFTEDLKEIDGLFDDLLSKRSTSIEALGEAINSMINRYETPPPVEEIIQKEDAVKILLAEDYKHSQIIVTRLLKKNGFENIVVVENGQEALEMAKKEHFALILMDMQMPIMNGFEATGFIRELPEYKDTPIIALTAFAMKGDREKCLESGATDYIPKPIDSKEFIEKVRHFTSAGA